MKLKYIITDNKTQHVNLAVEEFLTRNAKDDEVILMLWQNSPCVVIGKNQNPWAECNVERMKEDMVPLVRRVSGGGAVYHDLGNLNFTFVAKDNLYDKEKQTEVILQAVRLLGIDAIKNGRNDLTVNDKKFSGHAYWSSNGASYHHGTIMMQVFFDNMSKYLSPSKAKLQSKGVSSVRSRVTNIVDCLPSNSTLSKDRSDLIEAMETALISAFELVYGQEAEEMAWPTVTNSPDLIPYVLKFDSDEWIYGARIPFDVNLENRFDWGSCEIQLGVKSGIINCCKIYSDSLETEVFDILSQSLENCKYDKIAIQSLESQFNDKGGQIPTDILKFIADSIS